MEFNKFEIFVNHILEVFWAYREYLKKEVESSDENRFLSNIKSIQKLLFIFSTVNFLVCNNNQILKYFYKLYGESNFFKKQPNYICVSRIIKETMLKEKNIQLYYLFNKQTEEQLKNDFFLSRSFSLVNDLHNEEKLWSQYVV